jgi:hypothetical protein
MAAKQRAGLLCVALFLTVAFCEAGAGDEAATVQRYGYGYEEVSTPYLMPCVSAINAAERAQEVSDQTQRRMLEGPLLLTSTPYARRIHGSHCVFGKCSPSTRLASQLQVRFSPPGGVHCRPISPRSLLDECSEAADRLGARPFMGR